MNQRGFILPSLYLYAGIAALVLVAAVYVQSLRLKVARVEAENATLVANVATLEARVATQERMAAANRARDAIAADARIEAAIHAEKEKQRVSAERLAEASQKKAKLVEGLAHKAIENNVRALGCKSDLRDLDKECETVR